MIESRFINAIKPFVSKPSMWAAGLLLVLLSGQALDVSVDAKTIRHARHTTHSVKKVNRSARQATHVKKHAKTVARKSSKKSSHHVAHAKNAKTKKVALAQKAKTTAGKKLVVKSAQSVMLAKKAAQSPPTATSSVKPAFQGYSDIANGQSVISEGVRYTRYTKQMQQGPVRINVLEIDPKSPGIEIMPALAANKMGTKSNVANIVSHNQAMAGINGSFFKPDVGIPLGILMINQELVSGPIFDRVALGITPSNDLVMDRVSLAGEVLLPSGHRLPLHNINQPRVNPRHTVVYSFRWGKKAPRVPQGGYQVLLRNNEVAAVSTSQPLDIPRDGIVVSGANTPEMAELVALPPGKLVQLNVYTLPDWSGMKHAIGGGPWLVRNGHPYVDLQAQHFSGRGLGFREPRSAVGITQSGKLLLVAVDGRQRNVSVGMTLNELAVLMQQLGSVQAMNLDGGSSTQMAVYGKTVNLPSSGNIGVSNSLIIRRTNGDNVAARDEQ